jgi:hypothetical protein
MTGTRTMLITRIGSAVGLAVSGYLHAELYLQGGYRFIPNIGTLFLLQASASFAVALLLVLGGPAVMLRLAVAGLAAGALGGFVLSRTVGVLGFTEHGLQPAPQSLISIVAEIGTLILLATPVLLYVGRRWQPAATGRR